MDHRKPARIKTAWVVTNTHFRAMVGNPPIAIKPLKSVTKTLQTLLISRTPWTAFVLRKTWPPRMSALSLSSITDWQTNTIVLRSTAGRQRRPGAVGRSHEGSSVFSLGEQQQELPRAAQDSRRKTPGAPCPGVPSSLGGLLGNLGTSASNRTDVGSHVGF